MGADEALEGDAGGQLQARQGLDHGLGCLLGDLKDTEHVVVPQLLLLCLGLRQEGSSHGVALGRVLDGGSHKVLHLIRREREKLNLIGILLIRSRLGRRLLLLLDLGDEGLDQLLRTLIELGHLGQGHSLLPLEGRLVDLGHASLKGLQDLADEGHDLLFLALLRAFLLHRERRGLEGTLGTELLHQPGGEALVVGGGPVLRELQGLLGIAMEGLLRGDLRGGKRLPEEVTELVVVREGAKDREEALHVEDELARAVIEGKVTDLLLAANLEAVLVQGEVDVELLGGGLAEEVASIKPTSVVDG